MKLQDRLDWVLTVTLLLVAVLGLVRMPSSGGSSPLELSTEGSERAVEMGINFGSHQPEVRIVEFVDFQCPFCAGVHHTLDSLLTAYPDRVGLSLVHYPLSSHPQAIPAAIAVECADRQGSALPYIRELYDRQSDFPVSPWVPVAQEIPSIDVGQFEICIDLEVDSFPRIRGGLDLASVESIPGTPGLFVNESQSSPNRVVSMVDDELQGFSLVNVFSRE